jgi:hypothetical protein
MRVAQTTPATWRGRGPEALFTRHRVAERAVAWYQRACEDSGVLAGIRGFGARWKARLEKARSLTQSPSALQRLFEDLIVLRSARTARVRLHEIAVEIHCFIAELDEEPATAQHFLEAMTAAEEAEAAANAAERRLVLRAHRRLDPADLAGVLDAWRAEMAAKTVALEIGAGFLRMQREQSHRLTLMPTGAR